MLFVETKVAESARSLVASLISAGYCVDLISAPQCVRRSRELPLLYIPGVGRVIEGDLSLREFLRDATL